MKTGNVTVWCGYCKHEPPRSKQRQQPGKLGWLRRRKGTAAARWFTVDPRWHGRRRSQGWPAGLDVSQILLGDEHDPAELKVFCRWHGTGVVPTREVTSASGSLTLYFKATR